MWVTPNQYTDVTKVVSDVRSLAKFIPSAIIEIKHGGRDVRFYVTKDIAAAIRPVLERLASSLRLYLG